MAAKLQLNDIRRAWDARDPEVVALICLLFQLPDEQPEEPIREGAATFNRFLRETQLPAFRRKTREEQWQFRVERIKALEAADAEVPLPDRLRLHEILIDIWEDDSHFARTCLLELIARVPLEYGAWRALKRIFKEAEADGDTEVLGALAARCDRAQASREHSISGRTLRYLSRRGWRYLRRVAESLPAAYADTAVDFLAAYNEATPWHRTWIANHIFYHELKQYSRSRWKFPRRPSSLLKHRAYAELWRRSPRPLFSLLERAQSEQVRKFATAALKTDFRAALRDVEPDWVARLVYVESGSIDEFVVWILENSPRFEQSAFRELGLHEPVLKLFDSRSNNACKYAVKYARAHARDLPVDTLIRLADNSRDEVRKLAADLLRARHPRDEVGLEAWGRLLETESYSLAEEMLRKHFGARELTPAWFQDRLLSGKAGALRFATSQLGKIHSIKKLGSAYFVQLIEGLDLEGLDYRSASSVAQFALEQLKQFDLNELDTETLKRMLVHPHAGDEFQEFVDEGRLKAQAFPVDFLKVVAYHPAFESDPWIADLKAKTAWASETSFDESLSVSILNWLQDIRLFSPDDLGFEWLMQLVKRSEPRYHDFAVETMIKAFLPADFAPSEAGGEAPGEESPSGEINVDLEGASFVFTGKLATMSRSEAQGKVTAAGGANSSSVTKKLDYLVIGDEGSPLYGEGRKGSKQVKGEKLNAEGAGIKIISETAFLQMLAGEQREFSADDVQAGCEQLWNMLTSDQPDDPLSDFAYKYIRQHHPDICLEETDRPVDPGAEIPPEFLTFEQVKPLFGDKRAVLRELALEFAKWEFARWAPPIEGLIELSELPHDEVRAFVAKAMTADDAPEHNRYRVDPGVLTADAVYSFCESRDEATRGLGMELIQRHPRLQLPEELFRLTESPDRKVRAFVIRTFWSLYRDRGITRNWKPAPPVEATITSKSKKKKQEQAKEESQGAPERPEQPPAAGESLRDLLRRILFTIPPGPPERTGKQAESLEAKVKPLPARKVKLLLVEVIRDLALEDAEFAELVLPVLEEFMQSRGKSEMHACLVAVTQIREQHPSLAGEGEEAA